MPIRSYADIGTRDIAAGMNSKRARRKLPVALHNPARIRLAFLNAATSLDDLRGWPGLHLHELRSTRAGQYAIRINDQYRICFEWRVPDAHAVEIADYH